MNYKEIIKTGIEWFVSSLDMLITLTGWIVTNGLKYWYITIAILAIGYYLYMKYWVDDVTGVDDV